MAVVNHRYQQTCHASMIQLVAQHIQLRIWSSSLLPIGDTNKIDYANKIDCAHKVNKCMPLFIKSWLWRINKVDHHELCIKWLTNSNMQPAQPNVQFCFATSQLSWFMQPWCCTAAQGSLSGSPRDQFLQGFTIERRSHSAELRELCQALVL